MAHISEGTRVKWVWGSQSATGTVRERFTEPVTRDIAGTEVTRNASADSPAYLIEQDDGSPVLKMGSEIVPV